MHVTALLPPADGKSQMRSLHGALASAATAMFRRARETRHARIQRFLSEPKAMDALVPGSSELAPQLGNDKLRALRYGDDGQFGLTKLEADPEELRAALVAQRIRCWRALRPSEAFARNICRQDEGAACCRFLTRDAKGPSCAKLTPLADYLTACVNAGQLDRLGDNCRGRSSGRGAL